MSNQPLHRLREARLNAEVSLRTLSKRTGIPVTVLKEQEESHNIRLIDLFRWRDALGVPINELLSEAPDNLSETSRHRASLIQVMRYVKSLLQTEQTDQQQALTRNIETKLRLLMPELDEVRSWPVYGDRRPPNTPSRIESQIIATSVLFPELHHETQ